VSCARPTALNPGVTSTTVTFPVNVANTAVPQVVNTATVAGGGEPPATQGNNSTSLTTAVGDFDLTVSKAKSTAGNFVLGVNSSYTFTVRNSGSRTTAGTYSFSDTLPAGLAIATSAPTGWTTGAGWTCTVNVPTAGTNTAGNNKITCSSSTALAVNANSANVVVPVVVGAAAAPSVTNTVTVTGALEAAALQANNAFTLTTAVDAPDLAITKSHNGTFAVGGSEQYTITASNIGALTTTATITVVDTLPAGLTYVSTTGTGAGWTCGFASPNVTCTRPIASALGPITSAPPIVINVTPTAAAAAASPVTNTATVSGGGEPAGNSGNNTASDPTMVSYPPALAKSFTPASIPSGGTATLALTITNMNPAGNGVSLQGLGLSDPFPAGMTVASPPNLVNTCGGTLSSGGSQGDTLVALSGGATGGPGTTCVIQVVVTATGVGTLTNTTGQVSSSNAGIGNSASATLTTTAPGSPRLTKVTSPNPVGVGENAVLTFTITNKATATNDMGFVDTLPAGVTVPAAGVFGGTCTSTAGTALGRTLNAGRNVITVTGVDLVSNASCTVTIPVRSTTVGSFANTSANISGLAAGLTAAALSDTLVVEAVSLSKDFAPSSIPATSTATMSLVLANGPGVPEQNAIAFTETLPAGVVLASAPAASQCGGTVTGAAGGSTVVVSGATLAAGLQGCTITAVVTANAPGTYANAPANVTGLSINLVNNVNATLTVTPQPWMVPAVTKTNNQSTISPGDATTYVITVSNNSGGAFSGGNAAVFKDPAVPNLSVTGASCAVQGTATCPAFTSAALITAMQSAGGLTIPSMANASTVTFTVQATLTGNPTGTITNVATATANGGTNSAEDTDTIVYPGLLHTKTVSVLSDPLNGITNPKSIPGAEVLYAITVANTGAGRVDSNTLLIADRIPANTMLYVGNLGGTPAGPVTWSDSGSGLAFTYTSAASATDDVEFSKDGGVTWTYTPVPDANSYDAAVTDLRLSPKGRMAAWSGAGPYPSFTLSFKVRLN
jgi:uncharacterized repeat protein (TIGR01451 family)